MTRGVLEAISKIQTLWVLVSSMTKKKEYQKALGIRLGINTFIETHPVTQACAAVTGNFLTNIPQCLARQLCDEEMMQ